MKFLAVLATLAITVAVGTTGSQAAERTARLDDPALTGQTKVAPGDAREMVSLPPRVGRTGLSTLEIDRIRASIRGYLQAVTARDAESLYETLTPVIKDYYGNSKAFLRVLTTQVEPLANARNFSFARIEREADDAVQSVILTGPKGHEWMAKFKLQRQSDGAWGIMGCQVEALQGHQT